MTKIEWTEKTWNPIVGCTVTSPGCTNCYAMKMAVRLANNPRTPQYHGTIKPSKKGPVWTGKIGFSESVLLQPLPRKKPTTYFVNSMGDLFHPNVPDEWIDKVFAVMALCPQHTFQVLTKQAERMREYCTGEFIPHRIARAMDAIDVSSHVGPEHIVPIEGYPCYFVSTSGHIYSEKRGPRKRMRPDKNETGHQRVQLHRKGSGQYGDRILVHRLVLSTFVGPAPHAKAQGKHKDGNAANNSVSNLSWGDQSSNWSDATRHGTHRRYSKLTNEQVVDIRARLKSGETAEELGRSFPVSATQIRNIDKGDQWNIAPPIEWPLRNVWKGVSAEDQPRADERIPHLLRTPAMIRFVSAEPLLGPVDLTRINEESTVMINALTGEGGWPIPHIAGGPKLDWVIVGGESGPNARPMHPDWARGIRDQCEAAGVPFLFKQWGEWAPGLFEGQWNLDHYDGPVLYLDEENCGVSHEDSDEGALEGRVWLPDGSAGYWTDAPDDWGDETPRPASVKIGKKAAGRLLDGREWNDMPEVV